MYWKFLVFENLLIYRDIAVDTMNGNWPALVAHARGISTWTFQSGLGQSIYATWAHDPFVKLATLLGEKRVVFALPYLVLAKCTAAGIIAYLYLSVIGVSPFAAFVGGAGYAYCGLLTLLGGWSIPFGSAVVVAMLLLYSIELFLRKRPLLVPIASASIVLTGSFHLFFFALMTIAYLVFRLAIEQPFAWRAACRELIRLAGYFALGVAMTSWLSLPEVASMLASPRAATGSGSLFHALVTESPWKLASADEFAAAVIRLYGNDLTGTGSNYAGWNNALESPAFYCGLLMLVALPQVFTFVGARRKALYGGLICVCAIYLAFPFFRRLLSAFMGDYYRMTALLVTLVVLVLGARALSCVEEHGRISRPLLWTTTGCLALLLLFEYSLVWRHAPPGAFPRDTGFLVAATILIMVLHAVGLHAMAGDTVRRTRAKLLLALLVAAEICGVSFITVNHRMVLPASYLESGTEYFDSTAVALSALSASDPTFFRIEKVGYSAFLNDSLFQGYQGTRAYMPFNHPSYIAFLRAMDVPFYFPGNTAYIDGFGYRYLLNTLVSVKYLLASELVNLPGYAYRERHGAVLVYENKNFLPFGFTYDTMIPEGLFDSFSATCRDMALLIGFVPSPPARDRLGAYRFKPFPGDASCENVTPEKNADLVRTLSRDRLNIKEYDQTSFKGSITVSRDELLFLSIPFDRGWKMTINGRSSPLENVNIGFSGVPLHPGTYTVDLRYELPGLKQGILVSGIGCLVFLALLARRCAPVIRRAGG